LPILGLADIQECLPKQVLPKGAHQGSPGGSARTTEPRPHEMAEVTDSLYIHWPWTEEVTAAQTISQRLAEAAGEPA